MSSRIFLCSDHHLGDKKICHYLDDNGDKNRPYNTVDEMHDSIVELHNSLVNTNDKVYFVGDVVIDKNYFHILGLMNGKKRLVRGNHDIFPDKLYYEYFQQIHGAKVIADRKVIITHIPIHPSCIKEGWINITGHLHRRVINDSRYRCICLEQTGFKPVELDDIIS